MYESVLWGELVVDTIEAALSLLPEFRELAVLICASMSSPRRRSGETDGDLDLDD